MPDQKVGDWFVADDGKVAHRVHSFGTRRGTRWRVWAWCSKNCLPNRPATPEDRRCKRCEERSNA